MSYLVEPMQLDFLSNKDRENVFRVNEYADDTFNFKYVSTSHVEHIIKDVRRQRKKKRQESLWASLVRERDSRYRADEPAHGVPNVGLLSRGDTAEVDRELRRLEEDSRPERTVRVSKRRNVDGTRADEKKAAERSKSNGPSLTDEETDGPSTLERSPVSKLERITARTRKSYSERTLRADDNSDEEFGRSAERFEYNDASTARSRDGDDEGYYEIRAHPLIANKILAIQKKVSNLLDAIDFRLRNIPLPDGDPDLRRRQQCAMEFGIRFSRNYLYDLGRQIEDVRKHVRAVSPSVTFRQSRRCFAFHVQAIEQKLISAHQLLMQALTAYCKHIPSSVLKGQPGKVKEILQVVLDLKDICDKINLTADYYECGDVPPPPLGKDTKSRCALILSRLRLGSDNGSQVISRTVQSTPIERFRDKSKDKNENCKGATSRLDMYRANPRLPRKNLRARKKVRSCTRERRASSNVYATPERPHPTTPEQFSPRKNGKEITKRNRHKIRFPLKEDDISTMVSNIPTDSDAASSIVPSGNSQSSASIHTGSTTRTHSAKTLSSKNAHSANGPSSEPANENDSVMANASNPITAKELTSLVPVIADLMSLVRNQQQNDVKICPASSDSMQVLTEFLRTYRSLRHVGISTSQLADQPTGSTAVKNDERPSTNRESTVKNEAKNMRLICLPPEEENSRATGCTNADSSRMNFLAMRDRGPRPSEATLEALLKYRDDYRAWSGSNPMYTSKSQNKPWDVVAWIADKLIDEMVVDVSKEFEMPNVIQKLFELEFKEF